MIKHVRVDHRLLHGQVVFAWTQSEKVNYIIVLDDEVAKDEFRKMTLSLVKPANVGLSIIGFNELEGTLIKNKDKKIMVIVKGTKEAKKLIETVPSIKEINYGGIKQKPGSKEITPAVYLTNEELKDSNAILNTGVKIYMQQVPTSKKEKFKGNF